MMTSRPFALLRQPWRSAPAARPAPRRRADIVPPRARTPFAAMIHPDAAGLIADMGQPRWPGWQWLILLLLLAQFAALTAMADQPRRYRNARPPSRIVRQANAVRSGER